MRRITFFNEKGGEGKTTVSCHYGSWSKKQGKRVVFIDSCRQANATAFFKDYVSKHTAMDFFTKEIKDLENNDFICLSGETMRVDFQLKTRRFIDKNMRLFKEMGFDYVIFDTSPAMSSMTLAIFVASDAVLCPAHLHSFSYKAINKTIDTIIKNNANNKTETKLVGIIPNDITPNSTKQQLELGKLVSAYPEKILPPLLARKPFADAMDKLVPVWEMKPQESNIKKASHEMIKLMNGLDETLEKELA